MSNRLYSSKSIRVASGRPTRTTFSWALPQPSTRLSTATLLSAVHSTGRAPPETQARTSKSAVVVLPVPGHAWIYLIDKYRIWRGDHLPVAWKLFNVGVRRCLFTILKPAWWPLDQGQLSLAGWKQGPALWSIGLHQQWVVRRPCSCLVSLGEKTNISPKRHYPRELDNWSFWQGLKPQTCKQNTCVKQTKETKWTRPHQQQAQLLCRSAPNRNIRGDALPGERRPQVSVWLSTDLSIFPSTLNQSTSNSFSHIDFLKIHHSSAWNPMRGGHIRVTSPPCLHCIYMSKRSEHMNAKHYLSFAENDSGGLKESTVPMRFMLTSLSWFALEARNVTHAENCDDLCLSVKGCPTRFCQIPMALRICHVLTRFGTSRIKVTSTYRLHCVYMSKRSEHMNAKHCLSLAENDSGGSKKVQFLCDLCLLLFHDLR